MKYYLIAGEKSGDLHASNLIKALKDRDPDASFRAWGGDNMQTAGAEIVTHYKKMAFMGFWEVIKNLLTISRLIKQCKKDILEFKPDVVILVDYGGFNLRIASFTKSKNIQTYYYISPKVWAWNQNRAKKIKRTVDHMFVILPFEKTFYKKFDYKVDYVGNPLFDAIQEFTSNEAFLSENNLSSEKKIIALLPGSRKQEVKRLLAVLLEVALRDEFKAFQFVVAGVDNLDSSVYQEVKEKNIPIIFNQTYDLLAHAHAALVTSGTATLETALFEVPQVVVYKTSPASAMIIKMLIRVKFVSLVNLIADKEVVRELLQSSCTSNTIVPALQDILGNKREKLILDYKDLNQIIRTEGVSRRTASLMWTYLNEKKYL